MKILNICVKDYAGVGIGLTEAINAHTDHGARHLCMEPHHFRYKTDLCIKDPDGMRHWNLWADVVNCHVYPRPLARAGVRPLPLIMTQHGSYFRSKSEKCRRQNSEWGVKRTLCTTPDLTKYGAEWLPTAIPQKKYLRKRRMYYRQAKRVVCQTPSNPTKKDSAQIQELLGGRGDIQVLISHGQPHLRVLQDTAMADIFIDRFKLGLGVSGLEAAAMGIPVIACSSTEDEALIIGEVGYLPYYKAPLRELVAAVDALLSSESLYREYSDRSLQYIQDFHNYPVVAKRYAAICEEVLVG